MVDLIQELLLSHNCVIIPGFGAFIGNYNPSEIRLFENKIYPPNKTIAFNRSLQSNDGLLINTASQKLDISYKEAEEKVSAFSKQCDISLQLHKSFILKDIGRLILDDEHKIQFQPYLHKNYLPESFGLESMSLFPVPRLKDAEASVKDTYQRILHPELVGDIVTTRKFSRIPYWITAILAIAFLISTLGWNIHKSNSDQSYSSLLPVFENGQKANVISPQKSLPIPVVSVIATPPIQAVQVTVPVIAPELVQPVNEPVTKVVVTKEKPRVKSSYIVVGAFFDEIHARKVMSQAEEKGYATILTKDVNYTLFRVSVVVENENVNTTLAKIKSDFNQRAWVYCSNCILK